MTRQTANNRPMFAMERCNQAMHGIIARENQAIQDELKALVPDPARQAQLTDLIDRLVACNIMAYRLGLQRMGQ